MHKTSQVRCRNKMTEKDHRPTFLFTHISIRVCYYALYMYKLHKNMYEDGKSIIQISTDDRSILHSAADECFTSQGQLHL